MLVIWALGSIIIYRLKRFHITAIYVVCFVLFALLLVETVTGFALLPRWSRRMFALPGLPTTDLSASVADYGTPLNYFYGQRRVEAPCFYCEPIKEEDRHLRVGDVHDDAPAIELPAAPGAGGTGCPRSPRGAAGGRHR